MSDPSELMNFLDAKGPESLVKVADLVDYFAPPPSPPRNFVVGATFFVESMPPWFGDTGEPWRVVNDAVIVPPIGTKIAENGHFDEGTQVAEVGFPPTPGSGRPGSSHTSESGDPAFSAASARDRRRRWLQREALLGPAVVTHRPRRVGMLEATA
jgi:hypothetical protein